MSECEAPPEISIVMPCLNEANSLAHCIEQAKIFFERYRVKGEIIVADNGSTDGSIEIATRLGAKVVAIQQRGYGSALKGGIAESKGCYIIMGDSDASYDFSDLSAFIEKLRAGYDLVMGNRFWGGIKPNAMPPLHRYLGNPVLSFIGRVLFATPVRDFHCGLRGFSRAAVMKMNLQSPGMEFASEMVVKASLLKMKVTEVPTTLSPDMRNRRSHLRTWRDGWRHLQFILLYSPNWLFLYPGLLLSLFGLLLCLWVGPKPKWLGHVMLDVHTLLFAAGAVILGAQVIMFAIFGKVYAVSEGFLPPEGFLFRWVEKFRMEYGIAIGCFTGVLGLSGAIYSFYTWSTGNYGPLDPMWMMRSVIPSVLALVLGVQFIFSSFFLALLRIRVKN